MNHTVTETEAEVIQLIKKAFEDHSQTIDALKYSFSQTLAKLKSDHEAQIASLTEKLSNSNAKCEQLTAQNDELNKFKDVSMVRNLSSAVETLRRENDTLKRGKPSPSPSPPTVDKPAAPAPTPTQLPAPPPTPLPAAPVDEVNEEAVDFELLELDGSRYFLDPRGGDLYEVIGDPEEGLVGDHLGQLKNITLRGKEYVLNTATQRFYGSTDSVLESSPAGRIENNKAIMYKKQN